jgi:hypothetical protein
MYACMRVIQNEANNKVRDMSLNKQINKYTHIEAIYTYEYSQSAPNG